LSHNQLASLPPALGSLTSLQTLKLSTNRLADDGVPWAALAALPSLAVLLLDGNQLSSLPACIGQMSCLAQLNISRNQLEALPAEVAGLQALQVGCTAERSPEPAPWRGAGGAGPVAAAGAQRPGGHAGRPP
jgi:Leucine-rich repeat (LRR) protein